MEIINFVLLTMLTTYGASAANSRVCWFASHLVGHLSIHYVKNFSDYTTDIDHSIVQTKGLNQTCPKTTNYCYALWKETHYNFSLGEIIIIAQGCWESIGKQDCESSICMTNGKPLKALNDTNFCCCKGNFCNGNVIHLHKNEKVTILSNYGNINKDESYIIFFIIFIVVFILFVSFPPIFMLLIKFSVINVKKKSVRSYTNSLHLIEYGIKYNSKFSCDNCELWELLGQGRYGCVWKCSVGDQMLAVKIFQSHHRQYFYNELDIYCTPFMVHPSLLSYFGYNERVNSDGNTEYLLFLSLAINGTLQNYLRSNILEWSIFCNMALSIAKGLAFLHASIKIGDKFKPCINHRDLNTQNILVKEDLSCVICDLGFATKTIGSKYYHNGEEQNAETKSINDVGTLRYMPPEVLEGAVDLRDCETALKQIDVYALGIILWELSTRCGDFYPAGVECAPYQLPFETQLGNPTFEQMKNLICVHKARPLFPDLWHDSSVVRSVKETIEDCWDQDGEARLTSLCVEKRFIELSKKYKGQRVKYSSQLLELSPSVPAYSKKNSYLKLNTALDSDNDFMSNTSLLIDKTVNNNIVINFTEISPSTKGTSFFLNSSETENFNMEIKNNLQLETNSQMSFFKNLNKNGVKPKKINLLKSMRDQRKITWSKFKKIFKGKNSNAQLNHYVTNNLVLHENVMDLTTPIACFSSKFETEILLNNGKAETKINVNGNSSCSKSYKNHDIKNHSLGVNTCCIGTQIRKRPTTLPITKSTDFNNLKSCRKKSYGFKKNFKYIEKYKLNQQLKNKEERSLKAYSTIYCNLKMTHDFAKVEELKSKQFTLKMNEKLNQSTNAKENKQTLIEAQKKCQTKNLKKKDLDPLNRIDSCMSIENDLFIKFNNPFIHFRTQKKLRNFQGKRKYKRNFRLSLDDDRIMSGSCYNEIMHSDKKEFNSVCEIFNSLQNIKLQNSNQLLENIY